MLTLDYSPAPSLSLLHTLSVFIHVTPYLPTLNNVQPHLESLPGDLSHVAECRVRREFERFIIKHTISTWRREMRFQRWTGPSHYPACLKQMRWRSGGAGKEHNIISDTSAFWTVTGKLVWQVLIIGFSFDVILSAAWNKLSVLCRRSGTMLAHFRRAPLIYILVLTWKTLHWDYLILPLLPLFIAHQSCKFPKESKPHTAVVKSLIYVFYI